MFHTAVGAYDYHNVPKPVPRPEPRPAPNLNHSFENVESFQQPPPQSYYAPQQPQYGYPQQQQQQQDGNAAYGGYGEQPPPPQQQHQLPPQAYYGGEGGYANYNQPPPQQQQQQQYQNEQYHYGQEAAHLPPQPAYQAPPPPPQAQPPANPDVIRYCAVEVGRSVSKGRDFDFGHASIPRLLPSDVEEDLVARLPAPPQIMPVTNRSVRPTMHVFPASTKVADTVGLPVGVTVNPFADTSVPEVDFTEVGNRVIRCRRCNAYINPFTTFVDKGIKWQCIICRQLNDTLPDYRAPLDQQGLRTDLSRRPELVCASADFIATPEYLKTPPRRPIFLLMLDCSYAAVSSGLLGEMCIGALRALEEMQHDDVMRMGIVGYDTTVYFFNLRSSLSAPRMVAAPDTVNDISNVNDAFKLDPVELPCAINDLVVPIRDSYHLLKDLFEKLPSMFAGTKEVGCAFGPALAAAISMLENNGGKIVSSICSIPSHGQGALKHRFNPEKLSNQPKEYTMLAAANDWYKQRALACSAGSVSVDIITGNNAEDIDLATIAPLARFTAGHIYAATALTMRGVAAQVHRILSRFTAFDAVLRVRTSPGLVVPNFYGHCYVREPELLSLPVGTEDSSFTVEFTMGPNFKGNFAYIQFAVMYTSRARERRIRVHTLQVRVSALFGEIINSVNSIGMSCFLTKMCVDNAINGPFAQAQQAVTNKLVAALKAVQQHLAKQGVRPSSEQLLLPESMKYIPEIINGFFRCPAVGAATSRPILPDRRVASMAAVMASRPESLLPGFLSWTYQVYAPQTAIDISPVPIYSSQSNLTSRSVTLTTLAEAVVLWYGTKANHSILNAFGLPPVDPNFVDDPQRDQAFTPEQAADLHQRTHELIGQLRRLCLPAFCVAVEPSPQGKGPYEPAMARSLVEDDYHTLTSYKTFMLNLLRRMASGGS